MKRRALLQAAPALSAMVYAPGLVLAQAAAREVVLRAVDPHRSRGLKQLLVARAAHQVTLDGRLELRARVGEE